jgi:hypothetical protein
MSLKSSIAEVVTGFEKPKRPLKQKNEAFAKAQLFTESALNRVISYFNSELDPQPDWSFDASRDLKKKYRSAVCFENQSYRFVVIMSLSEIFSQMVTDTKNLAPWFGALENNIEAIIGKYRNVRRVIPADIVKIDDELFLVVQIETEKLK